MSAVLAGPVRAQTAGSLDAGFNPSSGLNSGVNALLVQPDGKAIVSGPFTQFGTVARNTSPA